MNNQFIVLMTTFFLSPTSVVWCHDYDHDVNFKEIPYPQLPRLNVTVVNETPNDAAIRNILVDIANGKLAKDDSELIELIKNSIIEASMQSRENKNNLKASIEAGTRKAQSVVTDVTAAYTQAILKANSPTEARQILSRFQTTIQVIVDVTKNGRFAILIDVKKKN